MRLRARVLRLAALGLLGDGGVFLVGVVIGLGNRRRAYLFLINDSLFFFKRTIFYIHYNNLALLIIYLQYLFLIALSLSIFQLFSNILLSYLLKN